MWFKNLYLLRLAEGFSIDPEALHAALTTKPFVACNKEQREASGWLPPLGKHGEQLVHASNDRMLVTLAHQEKILPASVIREELEATIAEIEEKEGRKVGKRERQDLRDEIEFELLPQAFTRTRKLDAWLDPLHGWLVVNTTSATQGERLTHLLRHCLGSLPVTPPKPAKDPVTLMTQWLAQEGSLPAPFALGEDCELRTPGEAKSVAVFKRHELGTEEVHTNLANGKVVSKLGLVWDGKVSFILTSDLGIRRVRFLDVLADSLKDSDPQSAAEKLDIEFNLMAGEVAHLLADLMRCFSAEAESPATPA